MGWRGYFNAWITGGQTAAIAEVSRAVAVLRDGSDPERLADALLSLAALLNRNGDLAASPVVLAEANRVLTALDDRWGLAVHDFFTAGHLAPMGDLDGAEASARASAEALGALREQFLVHDSLGMLAGVSEARGDLVGAVATYEELLERARQGDLVNHVPLWLIRLGALRARLDDDATAEQLFSEAVVCSDGPTMRGTALVGLAGAARRLGDVQSAHIYLDQAAAEYASVGHDDGGVAVLTARCWLAITTGNLVTAADFAGQACQGASHDDPSMRVSAQTAAAAVAVLGSGSEVDIERFAALVRERNGTVAGRFAALTVGAVGSTLDEPDVAAMCRTLGFANLSASDRA